MVTKRISPAASRGVGTWPESRREIRRGRQASCSCTKYGLTSELEERTGHNVTDVTSESEDALQVGRNEKNWKNEKWSIARVEIG